MPATPTNITLLLMEAALLIVGLVLLWRYRLAPVARLRWGTPAPLPAWSIPVSDFLLLAFLIVVGGLAAQFGATLIVGSLHVSPDARLILINSGFQLGLLASAALLPLQLGAFFPTSLRALRTAAGSGLVTFLIALPIVTVANLLWLGLLEVCGLPAEQQDLLRLFMHTESPVLLGLLIVLATVVAPVAEELLFRGLLFRYLRTRLPRWVAILAPAVLFASLHVNWVTLDGLASFLPLITLATILSLAYERTGRISTAIVAHAVFNLHTIVLLFAGVGG